MTFDPCTFMKNIYYFILLILLQLPMLVIGQGGLEIFQPRWSGYYEYYFQGATGYEISLSKRNLGWGDRVGISLGLTLMEPSQETFPVLRSNVPNAVIYSYRHVTLGAFGEFGLLPLTFTGPISPYWGIEAKIIGGEADVQGFTRGSRRGEEFSGIETGIKLGLSLKMLQESIWLNAGLGRNFVIVHNIFEEVSADNAGYTSYWKPFVSLSLYVLQPEN